MEHAGGGLQAGLDHHLAPSGRQKSGDHRLWRRRVRARGSLQAYDINTGKEVWKTWTVPGLGEPGNDTWKGDSWQHGGGAVWLVGSYDPKTNTAFFGTSNPSPWNAAVRSTGTSDYGNLRTLYKEPAPWLSTRTPGRSVRGPAIDARGCLGFRRRSTNPCLPI